MPLLSDASSAATILTYYRTVAPFYAREMDARTDLTEWRSLASRARPARVLDLGCGGGRLARAVRAELPGATVVGVDLGRELLEGPPGFGLVQGDMRELPFGPGFDLVAAANDPFAHLLDDAGRTAALREAARVLRPGGRVVVDGLWLTPEDAALARQGSLIRERALGGITLEEHWGMASADTYDTTYRYTEKGRVLAEAHAVVRAWRVDEPAIHAAAARVAGGLDGRPFDPDESRLVVTVGGAP